MSSVATEVTRRKLRAVLHGKKQRLRGKREKRSGTAHFYCKGKEGRTLFHSN